MLEVEGENIDARLTYGYELVLFKKPNTEQLEILIAFYEKALENYQKEPESIQLLVHQSNPNPELAAMVNVANVILNLEEVLVKG